MENNTLNMESFCPFCGQMVMVPDSGDTFKNEREAARRCTCPESNIFVRKENRLNKINEEIDKLPEVLSNITQDIIVLIKNITQDYILEGKIIKITLDMEDKEKVTISSNDKGDIKIEGKVVRQSKKTV